MVLLLVIVYLMYSQRNIAGILKPSQISLLRCEIFLEPIKYSSGMPLYSS